MLSTGLFHTLSDQQSIFYAGTSAMATRKCVCCSSCGELSTMASCSSYSVGSSYFITFPSQWSTVCEGMLDASSDLILDSVSATAEVLWQEMYLQIKSTGRAGLHLSSH